MEKQNHFLSAQGTIEYLLILGAVLAISLVTITLLTGALNVNTQQISTLQNKDYWKQQSVGLRDASVDASGNAILSLKNNSDYPLTLVGYSVDGTPRTFTTSINFKPQESKSIFFANMGSCVGKNTNTCAYDNIVFYYTTPTSGQTYNSSGIALVSGKVDALTRLSLTGGTNDWICVQNNNNVQSCTATGGADTNTFTAGWTNAVGKWQIDLNTTGKLESDSNLLCDSNTCYKISDLNINGGSTAGSTGYIQFNTAGTFGADSNLFWDNTNKRLGIDTNTPANLLDINGGTLGSNGVNLKGSIIQTGIPSNAGGSQMGNYNSFTTGVGADYNLTNVALGKTYTKTGAASGFYPDSGTELTDGNLSLTTNLNDAQYSGYYQTDDNFRIDLGSSTALSFVRAHYVVLTASSVYAPATIKVYGSTDDATYTLLGSFTQTTWWQTSTGAVYWTNPLPITGTYRYVKMDINWQVQWFFLDELEVYATTPNGGGVNGAMNQTTTGNGGAGLTNAGSGGQFNITEGNGGIGYGLQGSSGAGSGGRFYITSGTGGAIYSNTGATPYGGNGSSFQVTTGAGGNCVNVGGGCIGGSASTYTFGTTSGSVYGGSATASGNATGGTGLTFGINSGTNTINGGDATSTGNGNATGGNGGNFWINNMGSGGVGGNASGTTTGTNTGGKGFNLAMGTGGGGQASGGAINVGGAGGNFIALVRMGSAATSTVGTTATGGAGGGLMLGTTGNVPGAVLAIAGGATGGGTNVGGKGSDVLLASSNGGTAAGGTSNTGGAGGSIEFAVGAGGTGATANGADGNFYWYKNSTPLMILQGSNGYVGIGTATPNYLLDLNGAGTVTANISSSNAGITQLSLLRNGGYGVILRNNTADFEILTNGTIPSTVNFHLNGGADGNLGLGTITPKSKLNVIGDINATTTIASGTLATQVGKAICIKTGGVLGYCSSVIDANGSCTCN